MLRVCGAASIPENQDFVSGPQRAHKGHGNLLDHASARPKRLDLYGDAFLHFFLDQGSKLFASDSTEPSDDLQGFFPDGFSGKLVSLTTAASLSGEKQIPSVAVAERYAEAFFVNPRICEHPPAKSRNALRRQFRK